MEVGKELIPIPFTQEVKNTLIVGMVGSGKSQAIYNLIFGNFDKRSKKISNGIIDFLEPMIVYERKGEDFLGSLYRREKDFLFVPRDIDCIRWNIFQDMLNEEQYGSKGFKKLKKEEKQIEKEEIDKSKKKKDEYDFT